MEPAHEVLEFGKTMENLRKRVDVRLVTNEKKLDKLTSKPTYVSSKIFNENLMAVHKINANPEQTSICWYVHSRP